MAIPTAVTRYFELSDNRDDDRLIELFLSDATVVDDGETFRGATEILTWRTSVASQWTYTTTVTDSRSIDDDSYLVTAHLVGDFPGGEVDLNFRFDLANNLIRQLVIAP